MLRLYAPAKINIGLEIGGLTPDGYHYIETFMQTVDYGDVIEIEDSDVLSFRSSGCDFPPGQLNLCLKAHKTFISRIEESKAVSIKLTKKIPVGAGLGGGSSDAAAVIRGLNRIWKTGLNDDELSSIGAEVGADVPFFLSAPDGAAICSGKGADVLPMKPLWEGWAVIVFTGLMISTGWAYKIYDHNLTNNKKILNLKSFISECFPAQKGLNGLKNDFADLVFQKYRLLHEAVLSLKEYGASFSSLSGSGSAVYGLFRTEDEALRAVDKLPPYRFKAAVRTPAPNYH